MPIFNRCKLCKALVVLSELGSKGVCRNCMEHAIENAEALDAESKRQDKLAAIAEENAKKSDIDEDNRRKADEKAAEEARKEKEKSDSELAAMSNNTVGRGNIVFTITKGDESYECSNYAIAAEKIQCHHASIGAAVRRKDTEFKGWRIDYDKVNAAEPDENVMEDEDLSDEGF